MLPQYRDIVCWDFEYRPNSDGRPASVIASFLGVRSGRRVQLWEGNFGSQPPFSTGRDTLWVSYHASAETNCHRVLGWSIPESTIDLEAEFRCATTGYTVDCGKGLVGCVKAHGLDGIDVSEKKQWRDLVLRGGPYTPDERRGIEEYNWSDTIALARLFPLMMPTILSRRFGLEHALLRGYYSAHAVSHMEHNGVPIDAATWARIKRNKDSLRQALVDRYNPLFDIYEGLEWRDHRFEEFLVREEIPWPTYADGRPVKRDAVFREMSETYGELYPHIADLRLVRQTMAQLRESKLFVGADGRNRCMLGQFVASTGRNAPQAGKYIFGQPSWARSLITSGTSALAYVDWRCQEFVVAGACSGDQNMLEAAATGDPHMAFAILAGNAPKEATAETHPEARKAHKSCNLGVLYGMGRRALAFQTRKSEMEAAELLDRHRRVFPTYWAWSDRAVTEASLFGHLDLAFGWRVHNGPDTDPPTLMNAPMQGNAGEMMRIAACLGVRAGVQIDTVLHDAFLIEAGASDIHDAVATMRGCMAEASRIVLDGVDCGTDVQLVMPGQRYVDKRGEAVRMWRYVMDQLDEIELKAGLPHLLTFEDPTSSNMRSMVLKYEDPGQSSKSSLFVLDINSYSDGDGHAL